MTSDSDWVEFKVDYERDIMVCQECGDEFERGFAAFVRDVRPHADKHNEERNAND